VNLDWLLNRKNVLMRLILLVMFFVVQTVYAEIPEFFHPLVIKPSLSSSERLVDLTPAFEKAKQLSRPMLVYLGAQDCEPCKRYTAFLEKNKEVMKPLLAKVVLVDIRTWLEGPQLIFKVYDKRYTDAKFKAFVGDTRKGLFYPTLWYLSPEGKQIRQLPQSVFYFTTLASHIQLLENASSNAETRKLKGGPFANLAGKWKVKVGDESRLREFDVFRLVPLKPDSAALEAVYGWADRDPVFVDATSTMKDGKVMVAITTPASSKIEATQVDPNTFEGAFDPKWGFKKSLRMTRVVIDLSDIDKSFADEDKNFGVAPTKTLTSNYHQPTPLSVQGARTIKTLELNKLINSAEPPVVIDVLGGTPGKRMAIPSAVWLGDWAGKGDPSAANQSIFSAALSKLTGANKAKPIVFYCLNAECWLSYNAALRALAEGYKNVLWYRGGWKSWRAAGLPFVEAERFQVAGLVHEESYGDEDKNFGVSQTTTLTTDYHRPTPLSVPGTKTITTLALKKLLDSATPPIAVDVLGGTPGNKQTIPSAVWLGFDAGDGRVFATEKARFAAVLAKLTNENKAAPIVFFCLSVECWLSYNASLRAVGEGYSNVYWYRGGLTSWKAAGLPLVQAVPYAW